MDTESDTFLVELIRYNNWANARVFAACRALTPEQAAASAPGTYGSIHRTVGHIVHAEADYVGRMAGDRPQPPFRWEDGPSLDALAAFAEQVGAALLDAAQHIPLDQIVHEEEQSRFIEYQARHLFLQAIDHGIEHRTNITTILSGMGLPELEIDGWAYLLAHPDRFALKQGRLDTLGGSDA